tara:strand:+ start:1650 stop:2387 length:738 start_codon:yes stop_codon:yes gene_type:complete
MEKIIKNIYNKNAQDYHQKIKSKEDIWHKFIEKPIIINFLKEEIKNKKVLDLGCGSGVFVKKIISLGAKNVKGFDLSSELIKIAKKENPDIDFYVGNAQNTSFKNKEFDIVTSSLMAQYIKDLNKLFGEVSRILKKKGVFVFSMHHPIQEVSERLKINGKKSDTKVLLKAYFHNNMYKWKLKCKMNMISYHHTFEMIFNALNKNGFVVENLAEPRAPKKAEKYNKKIYDRSNRRPSFLIIKARKK